MSREWRNSAACRDQAPVFDFQVDGEAPLDRKARIAAALATCNTRCSVRAECKADINPLIDDGVRAGMVLARKDNNVPAGGGRGKISRKSSYKPLKTNLSNRDREGNRREQVLELTDKGVSAQEIAKRLNISTRAVTRHRTAGRAA